MHIQQYITQNFEINLQELFVDHNHLSILPESIVCCQAIKTLSVSHNQLPFIPMLVCDLLELKILRLNGKSNLAAS